MYSATADAQRRCHFPSKRARVCVVVCVCVVVVCVCGCLLCVCVCVCVYDGVCMRVCGARARVPVCEKEKERAR